jgi:hypothetical protein
MEFGRSFNGCMRGNGISAIAGLEMICTIAVLLMPEESDDFS